MTLTGSDAYDADDALFEELRRHFTDDEIVALTAIVAWENASSKFNRALRIPAQGLRRRRG
jgi:alkylhydroperoxidase family enzyme